MCLRRDSHIHIRGLIGRAPKVDTPQLDLEIIASSGCSSASVVVFLHANVSHKLRKVQAGPCDTKRV
jgi:hypothetical protein